MRCYRPLPVLALWLIHSVSAMYSINHAVLPYNYPKSLSLIPGGEPYCPIEWGSPWCKAAIQCSVYFLDLLYHPWWCHTYEGYWGTCCPDIRTTTSSVARFPEVSKSIALPRVLTDEEIKRVVAHGFQALIRLAELEVSGWYHKRVVGPGHPMYGYSKNMLASYRAQEEGWKALQVVEATKKLAQELYLSPEQAGFATQRIDVRSTALAYTCLAPPPSCPLVIYRTYDGSCNNLLYPNWGRAATPLERILPPQYYDGVWAPREWDGLPSVRVVSAIVAEDEDHPDYQLSLMVMEWGQFVDHDITHTPVYRSLNNTALQCCTEEGKYLRPENTHPLCFPIDIKGDDPFYSHFGVDCLEFVRSVIAPREDCKFGYADQINQVTHYLDGSQIYGSSEEIARSLREYVGGRLKSVMIYGQPYLPIDETGANCGDYKYGGRCFLAGDLRVNQYPGLTVMQTLWMRQHNRLAGLLAGLNPHWDDERLYQEARKIVGAQIQHITYNEYLPSVLGRLVMEEYGLVPLTYGYTYTYDERLNVAITNEFAAAAFRYGHSLVQNWIDIWLDDNYSHYWGPLHLKDWYNRPEILFEPVIYDGILRGLMQQFSQDFDEWVAEGVSRYLFKTPGHEWGYDLISFNLWRGRDHGLPGYNFYREVCGLPRANSFEDLLSTMKPYIVEKLKALYKCPDDIDLFIGGLLELPVRGGIVGPTFACIIADQFARLKDADRFYYELGGKPNSFDPMQLYEIRHTSLARVICDNSDHIEWVTPFVFWSPSAMNPWLPCYGNDIPHFDVAPWMETPPHTAHEAKY